MTSNSSICVPGDFAAGQRSAIWINVRFCHTMATAPDRQARQIVDRHDASSNEKSRSTKACLRHLVLGGYAYPSPLLPLN